MILYFRSKARAYTSGNQNTLINPLDNLSPERQRVELFLKENAEALSKITGTKYSHNNFLFGQLSYLKDYLQKNSFENHFEDFCSDQPDLDAKVKTDIKEHLINLVLFVKYEIESSYSGKYIGDIEKRYSLLVSNLGIEGLDHLIKDLSDKESLGFFNLLKEYANLQGLSLLLTRYIYNGHEVGRKDAYEDSADSDRMGIINPITFKKEEYSKRNITTITKSTGKQDQSLLGKIFMPVENSEHPFVHICWRGSQTKEAWISDGQLAPGFESHFVHEDTILEQIKAAIDEAVQTQNKPVNLMISGHSLGAALSQNTFNSIQRALCRGMGKHEIIDGFDPAITTILSNQATYPRDSIISHLKAINAIEIDPRKVSGMHLSVFNSPGVLNAVADSSNQCSLLLANSEYPVKQYAHYALTHGDLVQTCSHSSILISNKDNGSKVELFFFNNGQVGLKAKLVSIPASFAVGGVWGSFFPVVGTTIGAVSVGLFNMTVLAVGAYKGHTEKFVDEHGTIPKSGALKDLSYCCSTVSSEHLQIIQQHLVGQKSTIMQLGASAISQRTDLLGKGQELELRYPSQSSNSALAPMIIIGSSAPTSSPLVSNSVFNNNESTSSPGSIPEQDYKESSVSMKK